MGVNTCNHESTTTFAPTFQFKWFVSGLDIFISKVKPHEVKNIETVEGDGGVGSIKQMNFVEGGDIEYLKNKFHVSDDVNFARKYSLIEGDVDGNKLESGNYDIKFEAAGNGGCACKITTEYLTKGDYVPYREGTQCGQRHSYWPFRGRRSGPPRLSFCLHLHVD